MLSPYFSWVLDHFLWSRSGGMSLLVVQAIPNTQSSDAHVCACGFIFEDLSHLSGTIEGLGQCTKPAVNECACVRVRMCACVFVKC